MASASDTSLGKRKRGDSLRASTSTYSPIEDSEIRLVRYGRGSFHPDMIDLRLETFQLEQTPAYIALSYVWGDKHKTVPINLNSQQFDITENLYNALKQIRDLSDTFVEGLSRDLDGDRAELYLWIDAICINQDDTVEKSKQVPKISKIYPEAFTVLIWFGTFDVMPTYPDLLGLKLLVNQLEKSIPLEHFQVPPWEPCVFIKAMDVAEITHKMVIAYRDILRNEWFRRVWVVQEYALCQREPCALLGRAMFSFRALYFSVIDFMELIKVEYAPLKARLARFARSFVDDLTGSFGRTYMGVKLRDEEFTTKTFAEQLLWLSLRLLGKESTVPHDRIYALLGMLDISQLPDTLTPDYTKPYAQVCTDYTRFIIQQTADLRILSPGQPKWLAGQPSWSMDFRYHGSHKKEPIVSHCGNFSPDGLTLMVEGVKRSIVLNVFEVGMDPSTLLGLKPEEIGQKFKSAKEQMLQFHNTIIQSGAEIQDRPTSEVWQEWFYHFLSKICGFELDEGERYQSAAEFFDGDYDENHGRFLIEVLGQFLDRQYILMEDGQVCACCVRRKPRENEEFEIYTLKGSLGFSILHEIRNGEFELIGSATNCQKDEPFDHSYFAQHSVKQLKIV